MATACCPNAAPTASGLRHRLDIPETRYEIMQRLTKLLSLALIYIAAAGAGWLFQQLRIPLPWMIGPLVFSAALYISGMAKQPIPISTRPFGQMTVAAQVGLAFTPVAFEALLKLAPLLIGSAIATACGAFVLGVAIARTTGQSLPQAILGTFPTSPVEAAVMAERYGCEPAPIILSQTIRIAAVVVIIPILIFAIDGWPDRTGAIRETEFHLFDNLTLAALAVIAAASFKKLRLANPSFLGPLAVSAAVTAAGFQLAAFPVVVLSAAQIVLGTWLGSTFKRELFTNGGRAVGAAFLGTALLLIIVSFIATGLSLVTDQRWDQLILATAPGGVTEMALTAKYLGMDVALVTAFQITRIMIFMPNIPWIIKLIDRMERRRRPPDSPEPPSA